MTEDIDIDEGNEDDGGNPLVGTLRKELRQSSKRARELEADAEAGREARKELAFIKAGLPETGPAKFFREHYSGDLDVTAIQTAAREAGFMDDSTDTGAAAIESQSQAAQGATGNVTMGSDEEFNSEMQKAALNAPRGETSKAIAEVFRRYNRFPDG